MSAITWKFYQPGDQLATPSKTGTVEWDETTPSYKLFAFIEQFFPKDNGWWEHVRIRGGASMIVDEMGLLKDLPLNTANEQAKFYPGTIVGPIIVFDQNIWW